MKILLVSDTHGDQSLLENKILPQYASQVSMAIHLGDFTADLTDLQPLYPALPMVGVAGAFEMGPPVQIIQPRPGVRLMLTHGHTLGVKAGLSRLQYYAQEQQVQACFYGHTHVSNLFTQAGPGGDIFFINPGSVTEPRGGTQASVALVKITPQGTVEGRLINL